MLKVYPAIFYKENDSYWVEFPDLQGCQSCGSTLEETMEMAQEALGLYLVSIIEDNLELPVPTDIRLISPGEGIVSYVSVEIDNYRRNTKAVKKTLSIPQWMSDEAEKKNISLSKVLQEGLKEQLRL
jgi:antitoxin HicB